MLLLKAHNRYKKENAHFLKFNRTIAMRPNPGSPPPGSHPNNRFFSVVINAHEKDLEKQLSPRPNVCWVQCNFCLEAVIDKKTGVDAEIMKSHIRLMDGHLRICPWVKEDRFVEVVGGNLRERDGNAPPQSPVVGDVLRERDGNAPPQSPVLRERDVIASPQSPVEGYPRLSFFSEVGRSSSTIGMTGGDGGASARGALVVCKQCKAAHEEGKLEKAPIMFKSHVKHMDAHLKICRYTDRQKLTWISFREGVNEEIRSETNDSVSLLDDDTATVCYDDDITPLLNSGDTATLNNGITATTLNNGNTATLHNDITPLIDNHDNTTKLDNNSTANQINDNTPKQNINDSTVPAPISTVIHCWSAPRSRSTALIYSFHSRSDDCVTIDQPLYRPWLIRNQERLERPYKDRMINGCDKSDESKWDDQQTSLWEKIMLSTAMTEKKGGIFFVRHMAAHACLFDFEANMEKTEASRTDDRPRWPSTVRHRHVIMIRDPVAVYESWNRLSFHGNSFALDEVGMGQLLSVHLSSSHDSSSQPIIMDADQLASNPAGSLQSLCSRLDIPYQDKMLSWPKGPKSCDGPWAGWWYRDAHRSTGWNAHKTPSSFYRKTDPKCLPFLRASLLAYAFLHGISFHENDTSPYEDGRNADLMIWIGAPNSGRLLPSDMAGVSPWDSSVQGGDAVWEILRVHNRKIPFLERHLGRLFRSAKGLGFQNMHSSEEVKDSLFRTLAANGMIDGAHIKLTLTRGETYTSSINPKFNIHGTTLIILPEWTPPKQTANNNNINNMRGISLITGSNRMTLSSSVDPKIQHANLLHTSILPKLQANLARAEDAILLDIDGFVCSTSDAAANIFMVDYHGALVTPDSNSCSPGISREMVLMVARELKYRVKARKVSIAEFYAAEEVFTSGGMGGITPVTFIDGRVIGNGVKGDVTRQIENAYEGLLDRDGWATKLPFV